jgi:hypothetical protein
MNRLDQLRQQIDACRPGSDDLHLPELAELKAAAASSGEVAAELDRAQRFDQNVTSALYDVPVPAGLLDRLLVSAASPVALAGVEQAIEEGPAAAPADAPQAASAVTSGTRRAWLWRVGSIALAAAAALAIAVFVSNRSPREVTAEQLAADIADWYFEASSAPTAEWSTVKSPQQVNIEWYVPSRHALPWRNFKTAAGESGIVYQVAGKQVLLFVIDTNAKYPVGGSPTDRRLSTTGGITAMAWQPPGKLYVVVAKDAGQPIESFVKIPPVG